VDRRRWTRFGFRRRWTRFGFRRRLACGRGKTKRVKNAQLCTRDEAKGWKAQDLPVFIQLSLGLVLSDKS